MRSLQDWMKYLEQQEQSVQPEPEKTPREPAQRIAEQETTVVEPPKPVAPPLKVEAPQPMAPVRTEAPPPPPKPVAVKPVQSAPSVKPAQPAKLRKPRMPKAVMAAASLQETAQGSYKPFRETREGLLQRLLDPLISLEEAARILNVCPTTVRRYTNRGILKHVRTAGNQRRFKLSDVLAFMGAEVSATASDE